MNEATEKAGVATCLTEDVRQSLEDAGARLYNVRGGKQKPREENKIVRIVSDAISNTIDTVLAAQVQYIYHVYDIWIAWARGVLKGIIDMAQTIDWERCKLPVITQECSVLEAVHVTIFHTPYRQHRKKQHGHNRDSGALV